MKRINLKDFYPFYEEDCYVDVPDELAALMQGYERQERAYTEKTRYHKAYYSLERDPSLEKSVRYVSMSPEEIYERKLTMNELYAANEHAAGDAGKAYLRALFSWHEQERDREG